jgi:predicted acylesterase/phospholipase RssA
MYEVGALRALEEAIEGLDLTHCDIYVGVSAGAFIAASLANGVTTGQLVRGLVAQAPEEPPFDPTSFFLPAYRAWARRGIQLPGLLAEALLQFTRAPEDQSLLESLGRLWRAVPLGLFDNEPIRRYLETAFARPGRTNDFRRLKQRLFVVAADLEAGRPIVFGSPGWDQVPISRAVQASTALPGLYPPVEIEGRLCVDGVLLKTVHASVALEQGAGLVFCINPLVPVDVAAGEASGDLKEHALERGGLPAILSQTFRTLIHSRMVVGMAGYRSRFPGADLVLLEPAHDEYRLFFKSIFSFRSRREICEIGYRATRRDLWQRRARLRPILRRHGLALRLETLADQERTVWDGVQLPRPRKSGVTGHLASLLDDIESKILRASP